MGCSNYLWVMWVDTEHTLLLTTNDTTDGHVILLKVFITTGLERVHVEIIHVFNITNIIKKLLFYDLTSKNSFINCFCFQEICWSTHLW